MDSRNENRRLIERYPFLRSWGTCPTSFESTELDAMPAGWRIAFGEELCKEIMEELTRNNCVESTGSCRSRKNTVRFAGTHKAAQNGFIGRLFRNTRKCPGGSASIAAGLRQLFRWIGSLPGAMRVPKSCVTRSALILMIFMVHRLILGEFLL